MVLKKEKRQLKEKKEKILNLIFYIIKVFNIKYFDDINLRNPYRSNQKSSKILFSFKV